MFDVLDFVETRFDGDHCSGNKTTALNRHFAEFLGARRVRLTLWVLRRADDVALEDVLAIL